MNTTRTTIHAAVLAIGLAMFSALCPAVLAETASINVTFVSTPPRPLPDSIKIIRVQKPSYENAANDDGFMRNNLSRQYPGLWSYWYHHHYGHGSLGVTTRSDDDMAYRHLLKEIETQLARFRPDIIVLEYEDSRVGMDIQDNRRAAGQTDSSSQPRALQPDAFIVARFTQCIEDILDRKTKSAGKRVIEGLGRRLLPFGVSSGSSHEQHWVRHITVGCEMSLVNANTGEKYASHGTPKTVTHETKEGLFGYGQVSRAELESASKIVAKLVTEHVADFLGQVIPVERHEQRIIKHVSKKCARAIDHLNAKRFQKAAEVAHDAYASDDDEDHKACFVAGLANEALGRDELALQWYDRALALEDHEENEEFYQKAVARIGQRQSNARRAAVQERYDNAPTPEEPKVVYTPDRVAPAAQQAPNSSTAVVVTEDAPKSSDANHVSTDSGSPKPATRERCLVNLRPEILRAIEKFGEKRAAAGMQQTGSEYLILEAVTTLLSKNGIQVGAEKSAVPGMGDETCPVYFPVAVVDALEELAATRIVEGVKPDEVDKIVAEAINDWMKEERKRVANR